MTALRQCLHFKFLDLDIRHKNPVIESYFSITCFEKLYFSSVLDDEQTLDASCEMIIPLSNNQSPPTSVTLQRWQSHMVIFDYEIHLDQLQQGRISKRKCESKKDEILTFTVRLTKPDQIIIGNVLVSKTAQQYLSMQDIRIKEQGSSQKRGDFGACYFQINTGSNKFVVPVVNGNCLIYLPVTIKISQYKNGKIYSKSKQFTFQELHECANGIELHNQSNQKTGHLSFVPNWIVNQTEASSAQNILLHSLEVALYDFQLKFQVPTDFTGSKLKVSCNNKIYNLNDDLGNSKIIKVKKAVWIIAKSEDDYLEVFIERGGKKICTAYLLFREIEYYELIKQKHNLADPYNPQKSLGLLKFSVQKSKEHFNFQNLDFWKECSKKKSAIALKFQQLSVYYNQNTSISVTIKGSNEQKRLKKLLNVNYFEEEPLIYHSPVILSSMSDQTIYLDLQKQLTNFDQQDLDQDGFVGIALFKTNDLRLGQNTIDVEVYKNQQLQGNLNCLVTKYVSMPFAKSTFQPESLIFTKAVNINISMSRMLLTPYFYSYKYDMQEELFCIIEVNKMKKVLILESAHQDLHFTSSNESDNLNFMVQTDEVLKLKLTIMIGNGSSNQSIYGISNATLKVEELRLNQPLILKNQEIVNEAEILVGNCTMEITLYKQQNIKLEKQKSPQKKFNLPVNSQSRSAIKKGIQNQSKRSFSVIDNINHQSDKKNASEIRTVKNYLSRRKLSHPTTPQRKKTHSFDNGKRVDRQPLRLPKINQKKSIHANSLSSDLFNSMNVRTRSIGGYDYRLPKENKQTRENREAKESSIKYQDLRNANPNIDRNFELLFPQRKRVASTRQQKLKQERNKYQEKLNGLKSIMNQISNDIDPIQHSVNENNNKSHLKRNDSRNFQLAGNQFA